MSAHCEPGAGRRPTWSARLRYNTAQAEVAEWQTRRSQKPLRATSWGFESPLRHRPSSTLQDYSWRQGSELLVESVRTTAQLMRCEANGVEQGQNDQMQAATPSDDWRDDGQLDQDGRASDALAKKT